MLCFSSLFVYFPLVISSAKGGNYIAQAVKFNAYL